MKTTGRKLLSLILTLAVAISLMPGTSLTALAEGNSVTYIERSWDGTKVVSTTKTADCLPITSDMEDVGGIKPRWYVVNGDITIDRRLDVLGEVHIILTDGSKLTVNEGIRVLKEADRELNIYGQTGDSGELICTVEDDFNAFGDLNAAIGSNEDGGPNGPITIHGGKVTADAKTHGSQGAGIGAGNAGSGGIITIYGGTINALGGKHAAAIGSGDADGKGVDGGIITIYGGDITAKGGSYGAGIGGGEGANGGTITIWGGKVNATAGGTDDADGGAGIGSGDDAGTATSGGTITIHGGEVEALGAADAAGIGGGDGCIGGNITITGGTVKAKSGGYGAGIGTGDDTNGRVNSSIITITGGTVEATGGKYGAGIGGGDGGGGGIINIGGTADVKATGGTHAAGIGGGDGAFGDSITITGGTVEATGGEYGAGIGSGDKNSVTVSPGNINISGGTVIANGGLDGAGIGGGEYTTGGTINISGGTVIANARANADNSCGAGIGGGDGAGGGTITISGGHIEATGGANGSGIGNGDGGDDNATTITLTYPNNVYDISVKASSYRCDDDDESVTLKIEEPFMDKDTKESFSYTTYTGSGLDQFKNRTLVREGTYIVTVSEMQHGSVVADTYRAAPGKQVTLTVTPNDGWQLKSGTLKAVAGETEIAVSQDASDPSKYTFTMPSADVTVTAEFIQKVSVESISLNKETTTLTVDDTETLTAMVLPEDTDTTIVDRTVTWASSDESVAKVDGAGKVTAVAPGTATITATATNGTDDKTDDKTATCEVTVNKVEVAAPEIARKPYTGEAQTAEVPASDFYTVTTNEGGTAVGKYDVVLTLKDPAKYKWKDSDEATMTLVFEIYEKEHSWGEITYTWADDNSSVTATRVCKNDSSHVETETVDTTSEITKQPTCTENGETTYTSAAFQNTAFEVQTKTEEMAIDSNAHSWDAGKVTKEPTTEEEGIKTYTCTVCGETKTERIPKLTPAKPVLVAKGIAKGSKAVNLSWKKVSGADRYVIYMNKCSTRGKKYAFKKVKTVNAKTFKWSKGKLAKKTAYKFYVVAQKKSGGSYKTLAKSNIGHFFTGNGRGKYTNPKKLTLSKSALNLKKGKTAVIKGSVAKVKKSKKLATGHAAKLRYISNNPAVASVNAKGKVTAKAKGTAVIYVQTINGIWKTCKVTVK